MAGSPLTAPYLPEVILGWLGTKYLVAVPAQVLQQQEALQSCNILKLPGDAEDG